MAGSLGPAMIEEADETRAPAAREQRERKLQASCSPPLKT